MERKGKKTNVREKDKEGMGKANVERKRKGVKNKEEKRKGGIGRAKKEK